jgi:tetratricopeptide (TPR) repeat protein
MAIDYYKKLLSLENKDPKTNQVIWRVIVDNLGMAYGLSGDLKKAKETFEYGINKDPTYPMFYYNLACTYAETNDLENAIVNLKTAFKYKYDRNLGEGGMPDPRKDSSFKSYLNNEKFLKALSELN